MNNVSQDRLNSKLKKSLLPNISRSNELENQTDLNIKNQILPFIPTIGLIHTTWMLRSNKIYATSIGTAFAVSPHLVITCTHNVYTNRIQDFGSYMDFIPGIKQGQKPISLCVHSGTLISKQTQKKLSQIKFQVEPIQEELSMFQVKKPIELPRNAKFPLLANLQLIDFDRQNDQLAIAGYPSMYYQRSKFHESSSFKLLVNSGKLVDHNDTKKLDFMIHYEIKTSVGISGSPIFAINKHKQVVVVGIHTHSGKSLSGSPQQRPSFYNSGLYFTPKILQKIKDLERKFMANQKCKNKDKIYKEIQFYQSPLSKKFPPVRKKDQKVPDIKENPKPRQIGAYYSEQKSQFASLLNKEQESIEPQTVKAEIIISQIQQNKACKNAELKDQQKNEIEDELYSNKSALSIGYLQDQSFQNTSQIQKEPYSSLTDYQDL